MPVSVKMNKNEKDETVTMEKLQCFMVILLFFQKGVWCAADNSITGLARLIQSDTVEYKQVSRNIPQYHR